MLAYCLPIKPYKSAFLNFGLLVSEFVTIFISLAYFQFRENERSPNQVFFSFLVIASVSALALFNLVSIFIQVASMCKKKKKSESKQLEHDSLEQINKTLQSREEELKVKEDPLDRPTVTCQLLT